MSAEETKKKLIDLLFLIKRRQPLYLARRSVFNLGDFIEGFVLAVEREDQTLIIKEFGEFIVDKHPQLVNRDTFNILYEVSEHDEAKAFDLFFEEFESFLTEKGIEIPNFDNKSGG